MYPGNPNLILRRTPAGLWCGLLAGCLLLGGCHSGPTTEELFQQGRAAIDEQDWSLVRATKNQLKEMEDAEIETQYLEAVLYLNVLNYRASLDRIMEISGDGRIREDCMLMASQIFLATGDNSNAMRTLVEMLVEYPDNVDAHRLLAAKYYDFGSLQLTMQHCTRVSELDPDDPRPDRLMGLISKDFDKNELAVTHYLESLKRAPGDPQFTQVTEIRLELGEVYIRLRNYAAALASLAQIADTLDDQMQVAAARAFESECYVALGEFEKARLQIDKTLQVDPQHEHGLEINGTLAMQTGDPQQALKILQQAAKLHPGNDRILFKLSNVHRQLGQTSQAQTVLEQHEHIKQLKIQYIEQNVRAAQAPGDAEIRFELGQIAQQLFDTEAAVSWYRAALALNPEHTQAQAALAELLPTRPR
ncbi:MAG: tetratricopeptide repeat protein [Planctomycetota bacterium]|nr:tetratricopeptide repeat protein [Planctomycetota bacterium]